MFGRLALSNLFLIPLFLPLPFWFFDGLFKFFQRMSIIRGHSIEDYLNNSLLNLNKKEKERLATKIEKFNEKSKEKTTIKKESDKIMERFLKYDPASRINKSFLFFDAKYNRKTGLLACLLVRIVAYIYCIMLILTLFTIAIITNFYIFLWYLFIPFGKIITSWILSHKGRI